ncbi:MAG TPA: beta-ketoacyl synthase chain length factor [Steroidobacteraceae bacterium]|nr:beta-ketoacyl synthase chain length factor [Steroidobacteraceae bacterium]
MTALSAYIDGLSVIGPALAGWPVAEAVLAGRAAYAPGPTVLPPPLALPAAERRRTGSSVRLAIAAGLEAAGRAGLDTRTLLTVFTSSGGDGDTCHDICQTLATTDRQLSPTRFHNSVHNAAAGYWSIATGAMAASTTLAAYDAGFAAGLLEALAQVATDRRPVLLVAYDSGYPPPLQQKRPLADAFGAALALAPEHGPRSLARLTASMSDRGADSMQQVELERLRLGTPAGRSLPLLALVALRAPGAVHVEHLGTASLRTEIEPC